MSANTQTAARPARWRDFICLLSIISLLFLSFWIVKSGMKEAPSGEVTILHLNDVYRIGGIDGGTRGGLARVVWLRKDLERQGKTVIVTHAGDALAPSLLSDMYEGARMIEILKLVAGENSGVPLLFTPGNHEFDDSKCLEGDSRSFEALQERIAESNFIWLDGNLDYTTNSNGDPCPGWSDARTAAKREAFVNIPVNGINLGFFGLTIAPPTGDARMPALRKGNREAAKEYVRALRQQSDFVIGLTHLDEADDIAILGGPPDSAPDLILGGHEHDYRACVDHDRVSGLKRLYKGTAEALDVVLIHLRKDDAGNVEYAQQRVSLDEHVQPDADTQRRIDEIMAEHQAEFCKDEGDARCLDQQIGTRTTSVAWVLEEYSNRGKETVFGNWLTRLMLERYEPLLPEDFCTDRVGTAALVLSGSLRLNFDLPAGSAVTRRIVEETLPYDGPEDPQQAICITGAVLHAAIEHGLTQRFDGAWPHYSGLRAGTADDGSLLLTVGGEQGDTVVDRHSDRHVALIVADYVANGGDDYPISASEISEKHVFDGNLTIKSILAGALGDPDDRPDPDRDWPDGRKAWGTRNVRIECAGPAAR